MDPSDGAQMMSQMSDDIELGMRVTRRTLCDLLNESIELFNKTKGFPLSDEHTQLVIAIMEAEKVVIKNDDTHLDPMFAVLGDLRAKFKACAKALNQQTTP